MEKELSDLDDQIDELSANRTPDNMRKLFRLQREQRDVELQLDYQGADPKKIPIKDLKEIVRSPSGNDVTEDQYKAKIKNRATAIRAYCSFCMSGQMSLVRICPSVTCALWAFRMGKDPLRGYDIPKLHIELDKETPEELEDDDLFEGGDNDDD